MRTLITGYPKSGKTYLAEQMGGGRSTDETIDMGLDWSAGSAEVVNWLQGPYSIIEGVAVPRALRKYHTEFPDMPPPVEKILFLHTNYEQLSNRQVGMGKGLDKVWSEILPWLKEYGVEIEERR